MVLTPVAKCDNVRKRGACGAAGGGEVSLGYVPPDGKIIDAEMYDADLEGDNKGLKRIVQSVSNRSLEEKKDPKKGSGRH